MSRTFADLGVSPDLAAALETVGAHSPFPVQALTIPDGLAGHDLCGKAPTGSGKTLAFGIVAVSRLSPGRAHPKRPKALILTPTRELASQVATALTPLLHARRMTVLAVYGGVGYERQTSKLNKGVDVLVACPGRLADLIGLGHVRLKDVEVVVVDEADRMADMGFLPEVRKLLDQTPDTRQTLLYSATLDGDVDELVKHYQRDPRRHEVEVEESHAPPVQLFWKVAGTDRPRTTADIVLAAGPTMVFCRTKHGTDRVAAQLAKLGIESAAIHGDRSQAQRERALAAFTQGRVRALVATDVAARGIHVDGVKAVVHYDPPADAKDHTHRSGRTARAGEAGIVITFVTPEKASAVKKLQKSLGMETGAGEPDLSVFTEPPPPFVPPKPEPRSEPKAAAPKPKPAAKAFTQKPYAGKPHPPKQQGPKKPAGPKAAPAKQEQAPAVTPASTTSAASTASTEGKSRRQRAREREAARSRTAATKKWDEMTPGQRRRAKNGRATRG